MTPEQRMEKKNVEDARIKKSSFEKFMGEPMVRLLMSQIPQGEHADNMTVLLQTAFNDGFDKGQACLAVHLAKSILERPDR